MGPISLIASRPLEYQTFTKHIPDEIRDFYFPNTESYTQHTDLELQAHALELQVYADDYVSHKSYSPCYLRYLDKSGYSFEQQRILLILLFYKQPEQRIQDALRQAIFLSAAAQGHLPVLQWFLNHNSVDQIRTMIQADGYNALQLAAKAGHLEVLHWLTARVPNADEIYQIWAFSFNELDAVNQFVTRYPDRVQSIMSMAFIHVSKHDHLNVLNRLVELCPNQRLDSVDWCWAFATAAVYGHLNVMNRLIEIHSGDNNIPVFIQYSIRFGRSSLFTEQHDTYRVFRYTAGRGHLDVVDRIVELSTEPEIANMIEAYDYDAFFQAAKNGHLTVLNRIVELAPNAVLNMIRAGDYKAFLFAARNGNLEMLNRIVELCPDEIEVRRMIQANDATAYSYAVYNGHLDILNRMVVLAPNEVHNMIQRFKILAVGFDKHDNHRNILDRINELCPDYTQRQIQYNFYEFIWDVTAAGHWDVLDWVVSHNPTEVHKMICINQLLLLCPNSFLPYHSYPSIFRDHMSVQEYKHLLPELNRLLRVWSFLNTGQTDHALLLLLNHDFLAPDDFYRHKLERSSIRFSSKHIRFGWQQMADPVILDLLMNTRVFDEATADEKKARYQLILWYAQEDRNSEEFRFAMTGLQHPESAVMVSEIDSDLFDSSDADRELLNIEATQDAIRNTVLGVLEKRVEAAIEPSFFLMLMAHHPNTDILAIVLAVAGLALIGAATCVAAPAAVLMTTGVVSLVSGCGFFAGSRAVDSYCNGLLNDTVPHL